MKIKIKNDPAIDQIREIRHQISAEFGHDPRKVLAYSSEFEEKLLRERCGDHSQTRSPKTR
jgi:hypothetical protein